MKTTIGMKVIRDNVFFTQWVDIDKRVYLQRKRLPENRRTPETLALREKYIAKNFNIVKTIAWCKKSYNWTLRHTVRYVKDQFYIEDFKELRSMRYK